MALTSFRRCLLLACITETLALGKRLLWLGREFVVDAKMGRMLSLLFVKTSLNLIKFHKIIRILKKSILLLIL